MKNKTLSAFTLMLMSSVALPTSGFAQQSGGMLEEIVVTAQQIGVVEVALGPSATFSLQDLQDAPAINRRARNCSVGWPCGFTTIRRLHVFTFMVPPVRRTAAPAIA